MRYASVANVGAERSFGKKLRLARCLSMLMFAWAWRITVEAGVVSSECSQESVYAPNFTIASARCDSIASPQR